MRVLGLEITTSKRVLAKILSGQVPLVGDIVALKADVRELTADRDAANKQIERLLHNGTELPILWAAIRQAGHEKQVRLVYERLSGAVK